MSKRCSEDIPVSSKSHKKTKLSTLTLSICQKLAKDELGCVFNFLSEKDLINSALSCQEMNQFIRDWLLVNHPLAIEYLAVKNWEISDVLMIRKLLSVDGTNKKRVFPVFQKIAEHYGGDLNPLTQKLHMDDFNDELAMLLDIPIKNMKSCYNKKISHVILEPSVGNQYEVKGESTTEEKRTIQEKEYAEISFGFLIKNLAFSFHGNMIDMYNALRQCHSVEKLTISFEDTVSNDTVEQMFAESDIPIECPMLTSLKKLKVYLNCILDDAPSQKPIIDILKLAPNLKKLDIFFHNYCDTNILMHISRMCPNLEKLEIDIDRGYGSVATSITDQELYSFLKALPKLRHLSIRKAHQITGEFYAKIGEFPQLEYFRVPRSCGADYESDVLEPEIANFKFGGGSLPNLIYLRIGDISLEGDDWKALREMAPKLTDLKDIQYSY